jgi:hypothetical protein
MMSEALRKTAEGLLISHDEYVFDCPGWQWDDTVADCLSWEHYDGLTADNLSCLPAFAGSDWSTLHHYAFTALTMLKDAGMARAEEIAGRAE